MPSDETLRRIKAIKKKVEEVGETLGIPHDEATMLLIADAFEQGAKQVEERQSIIKKALAYTLGLMKT